MNDARQEVTPVGELPPGTVICYYVETDSEWTIVGRPLPEEAPEYMKSGHVNVALRIAGAGYWGHSPPSNRIARDWATFQRLKMGGQYGDGWVVSWPDGSPSVASVGEHPELVLDDGLKEWDS